MNKRCSNCGRVINGNSPGEYCDSLCEQGLYLCSKCGNIKSIKEFGIENNKRRSVCKKCKSAKFKKSNQKCKKSDEEYIDESIKVGEDQTATPCVDCGRPTTNHRCDQCWRERRLPSDTMPTPIEYNL